MKEENIEFINDLFYCEIDKMEAQGEEGEALAEYLKELRDKILKGLI